MPKVTPTPTNADVLVNKNVVKKIPTYKGNYKAFPFTTGKAVIEDGGVYFEKFILPTKEFFHNLLLTEVADSVNDYYIPNGWSMMPNSNSVRRIIRKRITGFYEAQLILQYTRELFEGNSSLYYCFKKGVFTRLLEIEEVVPTNLSIREYFKRKDSYKSIYFRYEGNVYLFFNNNSKAVSVFGYSEFVK